MDNLQFEELCRLCFSSTSVCHLPLMATGSLWLSTYVYQWKAEEDVKCGKVTVHCTGGSKQKVWGEERKKRKKLELKIIQSWRQKRTHHYRIKRRELWNKL